MAMKSPLEIIFSMKQKSVVVQLKNGFTKPRNYGNYSRNHLNYFCIYWNISYGHLRNQSCILTIL